MKFWCSQGQSARAHSILKVKPWWSIPGWDIYSTEFIKTQHHQSLEFDELEVVKVKGTISSQSTRHGIRVVVLDKLSYSIGIFNSHFCFDLQPKLLDRLEFCAVFKWLFHIGVWTVARFVRPLLAAILCIWEMWSPHIFLLAKKYIYLPPPPPPPPPN